MLANGGPAPLPQSPERPQTAAKAKKSPPTIQNDAGGRRRGSTAAATPTANVHHPRIATVDHRDVS